MAKLSKNEADKVIKILAQTYPDAETALNFNSTYELLVAVMLSAQCTDKRVNQVTKVLFQNYNTPQKMITLTQTQLENYIHSCGFYHDKARHILESSHAILDRFNGEVPNNLDDLQTLPGVGRKTANVVYSVGFNGQAIAVDTHVFRVSHRLGLSEAKDVVKTELDLNQLIDKNMWRHAHHFLIHHGREVCHARKPSCEKCNLNHLCNFYKDQK